MKWVTREHPHTDRIACPWLIKRFIDRDGEIVYVPRDQVLDYAATHDAISFDAPGARYTHRDGLCSFEVLVEEHQLGGDPALALVAQVVHGADVSEDADATPQSRGLEAIARGFMHLGVDDQEQLRLELPVYDALYAWARLQVNEKVS
ncbi:MAG TPA: chromate resistance protein ChrB domain-containing protein [Candidatus Limnocylindrales bacterium]|nr:chromate resistance protein ChrB domain-containing protein [Candidatus Limnocylindrales bacterium]